MPLGSYSEEIWWAFGYIRDGAWDVYFSHQHRYLNPSDWTSVHGILQARIMEWVSISSSRESSWPRVKPESPVSLALQVDSVSVESPGKAIGREWRTWLIGDAPTFRHKPRGKWENQGGGDFWRSWSWFNTKENEGPKGSWVSRNRQGIVASDPADKQGADTCPLSWWCAGHMRKASYCPAGPWQAQVQWGQGCRLQGGDLMRELEIRKWQEVCRSSKRFS